MDVDPMYMMSEINRVIRPGGSLLISTPNSASYLMIAKVLNGYRPHFYMQYQKDRSPYRHNFEHDRHSLEALTAAAGFETVKLTTVDVFGGPHPEGVALCKQIGASDDFRGDCLFYSGKKVSGVVDRYPSEVYA
jgi:hypothetical protein